MILSMSVCACLIINDIDKMIYKSYIYNYIYSYIYIPWIMDATGGTFAMFSMFHME